ncbi:MAG TPA: hypothetical protein VE997_03240 [Candidatus Limnocylindria bacterium]|nr:hypothetical protein [Candidatus Limnocylindria bacterium]
MVFRRAAAFFALRLGFAFALGLAAFAGGRGAEGMLGPGDVIGGMDEGGAGVGIQGWGSPNVRSIVSSLCDSFGWRLPYPAVRTRRAQERN